MENRLGLCLSASLRCMTDSHHKKVGKQARKINPLSKVSICDFEQGKAKLTWKKSSGC